jgi:hypothetical protein
MYLSWTSRIPGQVPQSSLCEISAALLRHACRIRQCALVLDAGLARLFANVSTETIKERVHDEFPASITVQPALIFESGEER